VRPFPSPPMKWWYQISVRIDLVEGTPPVISSHFTMNPGSYGFATASDALSVTYVSPDFDTYLFYTGRMPFGGALAFSEYHGHQKALQASLFFSATTEQLGLTSERLWTAAHVPRVTTTTGLADNKALRAELMQSLKTAQATAAPTDLIPEPRLVCTATASVEQVDGMWFDRTAAQECANWTFNADDIFSVVQLSGPSPISSSGKSFVGMGAVRESTALSFPQHDNWIMWYVAADGDSHYSFAPYATTLDVTSSWGYDRIVTLRSMLGGGTPQYKVSPLVRSKLALVLFFVWVSSLTPAGVTMLFVLCALPLGTAGFCLRRGVSCLANLLLVVLVFVFEMYLFSLIFYVNLPRHVDINPHDADIFLAKPLTEFELGNDGKAQLAVSLGVVAASAVTAKLAFFSPKDGGEAFELAKKNGVLL